MNGPFALPGTGTHRGEAGREPPLSIDARPKHLVRTRSALAALVCTAVCWIAVQAPVAQARPSTDACARAGTDLDLEGLGQAARDHDVGEAVRRACRSTAPTPPPATPAPPPPPKPAPPKPPVRPSPEPPAPAPAPAPPPQRDTPAAKPPPPASPSPKPSPKPSVPRAYDGVRPEKKTGGPPLTATALLLVVPAVLAAAALARGSGRGRS
ncbi:hypothetical protein [Streptomyces sp. NPDC047525]|uniref:hypothetical protein n=1 Tax=Streptomyces sp. NPDC047525 TaxID=3155264 RepID=UPI0033E371C5